jgi:hypothetical protein
MNLFDGKNFKKNRRMWVFIIIWIIGIIGWQFIDRYWKMPPLIDNLLIALGVLFLFLYLFSKPFQRFYPDKKARWSFFIGFLLIFASPFILFELLKWLKPLGGWGILIFIIASIILSIATCYLFITHLIRFVKTLYRTWGDKKH